MAQTTKSAGQNSLETAQWPAQNSAVLVDRSNLGWLKFTGKSRLDLINRMSTQKVDQLRPFEGAATILTTDIGRIIDRLFLYENGEKAYCLTGENNSEVIANYLQRFVFFMDDFQSEDLSSVTAILAIYGQGARSLLEQVTGTEIEIPLHHWHQIEQDGLEFSIHRTDPIGGDGFFLICRKEDRRWLVDALVDAGGDPINEDVFEYLRIDNGMPRFAHEITGDYIPLEANLWSDVSFNKGCYTGQEIIARMESRGRVAKRMVKLFGDQPIDVGQTITIDGKKAGSITSSAEGPGGYLALGFIKSSLLPDQGEEESQATVEAGEIPLKISHVY
jgi:aminomethyltransferase